MKKLDRTPPRPTGNTQQDVKAMADYLNYMVEHLNWILTMLEKQINGGE